MLSNGLFWQALGFSTVAIGLVVLTAWWLYLSPVKAAAGVVAGPSLNFSLTIAGLLALSGFQLVAGGFWDASMHILTGEVPGGADFLWPPHIMIYSSFFVMLIIAGVATRSIALPARRAGVNDPRQWARRSPYVGAVVIASLYGLASIPGDAIWHALFGIDLTAWSPPHIMIALASAAPSFAAAGLVHSVRSRLRKPSYADLLMALLLAIGVSLIYMVGVIEWELPGNQGPLFAANPLWVYPVVGGGIAFFGLMVAKRLIPHRWAALGTALAYFAIRLIIMIGLAATEQVIPYLPLVFIAGAFLIDWLPWEKVGSTPGREALLVAAFTLAYVPVAAPVLQARPDFAEFATSDIIATLIGVLILGAILSPLARLAGEKLAGESTPTPQTAAGKVSRAK